VAADWAAAKDGDGYCVSTLGADLDEVGFIHASFAEQLDATAARSYSSVTEPLVVLVIDPTRLGCEVREEPVPGGQRFPHVYGPIPPSAVVEVRPVRLVDGRLEPTSDRPRVPPRAGPDRTAT
jgi:uncharacterized protein (DUF952 family)